MHQVAINVDDTGAVVLLVNNVIIKDLIIQRLFHSAGHFASKVGAAGITQLRGALCLISKALDSVAWQRLQIRRIGRIDSENFQKKLKKNRARGPVGSRNFALRGA